MKKQFALTLLVLCAVSPLLAQYIKKPAEGKAVVYFVRTSSLGAIINFKYFDGEKYLGKFNLGNYMAYECDAGYHVFWSKSENTDFIEANLEAGKVYFVDSEPIMGMIKAGVKLQPVYPAYKKFDKKKKKILQALKDDQEFVYDSAKDPETDYSDMGKDGMEKFNKRKGKGETFLQLDADMAFDPKAE